MECGACTESWSKGVGVKQEGVIREDGGPKEGWFQENSKKKENFFSKFVQVLHK